jgi:hypothetical protein
MTVVEKISAALNANLGRCPRCMRQSFVFVLGTWGLVLVMTLVTISPPVLTLATVFAAGATGLWLSHLTAFALRVMRSASTSKSKAIGRNVVTVFQEFSAGGDRCGFAHRSCIRRGQNAPMSHLLRVAIKRLRKCRELQYPLSKLRLEL